MTVVWDLEHAYRLHIATSGGDYMQYTWSWVTNTSWGERSEDEATVAVIDGGTCKECSSSEKLVLGPGSCTDRPCIYLNTCISNTPVVISLCFVFQIKY